MKSNLSHKDRQKQQWRDGGKTERRRADKSFDLAISHPLVPDVCPSRNTSRPQAGITLFEVVLALAIFLGALASISQILRNGSKANIQARMASEATLRCETQMNELVAGSLPLETVSRAAFEDDPNWTWSVVISDTEIPDLLEIQVTVEHINSRSDVDRSFQLTRLMRDPQLFIDAATTASTTGSGSSL